MPSWPTHRRFYEKFCRETGFRVWTRGLLEKIDRIIDASGEHDLGRPPDPNSFRKLLRELWLEFGDIYNARLNKFLGLKDKLECIAWEREAISKGLIWGEEYLVYIPDDAIILALLHHILDLCTYFLRKYPIGRNESHLMVKFVREIFEKSYLYINELRSLKSMTNEAFDKILRRLIDTVEGMSEQVYDLLIEYLSSKGLKPGYSLEALRDLLVDYVRRKGYYGIIYVNGAWLPVAAAASRIFKDLMAGQRVEIGFSKYRGPYPPIHKRIEVTSLEDLIRKLS